MYFTKDKVIYKPYEHLTIFPLVVEQVPGYTLLKTESERSKYGINTVPVYLLRDKKLEKGETFARIKEECLLEHEYPYNKLQELYASFFYHHLKELYERVRVFYRRQHKLEITDDLEVNEKKLLKKQNGYTSMNSGSFMDQIVSMVLGIEEYSYLYNTIPVICEKAIGEMSYDYFGVPLEMEDTLLLKLGKKEGL